MKLLFDQGTPLPLRHHLPHHTVETAYEKGWSSLKNGDLLTLAEAEGFDVLITTDQNLRHQQQLSGRGISVVVLRTTNWPRIKENAALVARAIDNVYPGSYDEVAFP
jgi:predicted nuclease of predicted toxin-antitoxin system